MNGNKKQTNGSVRNSHATPEPETSHHSGGLSFWPRNNLPLATVSGFPHWEQDEKGYAPKSGTATLSGVLGLGLPSMNGLVNLCSVGYCSKTKGLVFNLHPQHGVGLTPKYGWIPGEMKE